MYTVTLAPHPETPSQIIQGITVRVSWEQEETLACSYTLTGDCTRILIPELRSPARVDGLWQHTCFEAFVSGQGDAAYWEYNFSPSGEWACYQFRGYRDHVASEFTDTMLAPEITTQATETSLLLYAYIYLPHSLRGRTLRVALSTVVEEKNGARSYWALRHPSGKPDFHHSESFSFTISPPHLKTTRGNLS